LETAAAVAAVCAHLAGALGPAQRGQRRRRDLIRGDHRPHRHKTQKDRSLPQTIQQSLDPLLSSNETKFGVGAHLFDEVGATARTSLAIVKLVVARMAEQ
jgi:hypothetical protein